VPELSVGTFIHNRVKLFWVPGHCGIIGNEEINGLAGVGFKSSFCGLEPSSPVPKSLMTRVTKKWLLGNHLSYWNLVSGCRKRTALHLICVCQALANLRTQIFGKPILSVSEYEGMSALFCNLWKISVDLRPVLNETSIMGPN
jgi:hypothetical protein